MVRRVSTRKQDGVFTATMSCDNVLLLEATGDTEDSARNNLELLLREKEREENRVENTLTGMLDSEIFRDRVFFAFKKGDCMCGRCPDKTITGKDIADAIRTGDERMVAYVSDVTMWVLARLETRGAEAFRRFNEGREA